jgi:RNA polymerase sigma factor (sigma-70 family)
MPAAPLLKDSDLRSEVTDARQPESPAGDPATRGRRLLETHLDLIQRKLQHLSRYSGLPDIEAEEFRPWALFKLVDDDYRILGRWEGRSSFPTFLTVVLVNLLRDYRIRLWRKWRPSAEARRRGPASVLLERLVVRDGLTVDAAVERLRTEHGLSPVPGDVERLERLAATPPWRHRWRRDGEEVLLHIPVDGEVEARIEERELACTADRLRKLLAPLLESLPAEERLLLRLSFFEGLSIASIAPILGRPQKELYKVRERCLRQVRRSLREAGISPEQVRELIGRLQGSLGLERSLSGR